MQRYVRGVLLTALLAAAVALLFFVRREAASGPTSTSSATVTVQPPNPAAPVRSIPGIPEKPLPPGSPPRDAPHFDGEHIVLLDRPGRPVDWRGELFDLSAAPVPTTLSPPRRKEAVGPVDRAKFLELACTEVGRSESAAIAACSTPLRPDGLNAPLDLQLADFEESAAARGRILDEREVFYTRAEVVDGVPIEHFGVQIVESARSGTAVIGAALLTNFVILGARPTDASMHAALSAGLEALGSMNGVTLDPALAPPPDGVLVLLPDGVDPTGRVILRYAWRTMLRARVRSPGAKLSQPAHWVAWIGSSGGLLAAEPQVFNDSLPASVWARDADPANPTRIAKLTLDPPTAGQYTLKLVTSSPGVVKVVDRFYNFTDDGELNVPASTTSLSAPPWSAADEGMCDTGSNPAFRQINTFHHFTAFRRAMLAGGAMAGAFDTPVNLIVDAPPESCSGGGSCAMTLGSSEHPEPTIVLAAGQFGSATCPDGAGTFQNRATDSTSLAHEAGHLLFHGLNTEICFSLPWLDELCVLPNGGPLFHDLADAFAADYAGTSCFDGWAGKNMGNVDASKGCLLSDEGGNIPREARAADPDAAFNNDGFPDHHASYEASSPEVWGYADGQVAAAALWAVREGMRSRYGLLGAIFHRIWWMRAIRTFGFIVPGCENCERDTYRFLSNLEHSMVRAWGGSASTNKVLAGFARAGIFHHPWKCLDGDPATTHSQCPSADAAGDAIIDVEDDEPSDDPIVLGVTHPEGDYLKHWPSTGAKPPTFRIWTGPSYRFGPDGTATYGTTASPAFCNSEFKVDLSLSPDFSAPATVPGSWQTGTAAARTSGTRPLCYRKWTPAPADWALVAGGVGRQRVYYRVLTRRTPEGPVADSLRPGGGTYETWAPSLMVTDSGMP